MADEIIEDDFFADPPVQVRAYVVPKTESESQLEQIKTIEDGIYSQAQELMSGAMSFHELDPENPVVPKEWVLRYGLAVAKRKHRLALAGLMDSKSSPVALKLATAVHSSIVKARASERGAVKQLNIQVLQLTSPLPQLS